MDPALDLESTGPEKPGTSAFYWNVALACACVCMAALAAGLTMGLVSLDPFEVTVILKSEETDRTRDLDKKKLREDQRCAQAVFPIIQDHHWLLVTLLLMNSIANEALPL